jgi:hypothetical protein
MPKCDTTKAQDSRVASWEFVTWLGTTMQNITRPVCALLSKGGLIPVVFASLILFLSGAADAACVDGINDKNGKPCGGSGDDGDGGSPSTISTTAQWIGFHINEPSARDCLLESAQPSGDHGVYVCDLSVEDKVNYPFGSMNHTLIGRKGGDEDLCKLSIEAQPEAKYNYAWTDNCQDDDTCTIRIINWIREGASEIRSDVGAVIIHAFAEATPGDDLNPFTVDQALKVDLIEVAFQALGRNKTLAKCQYTPADGAVVFASTPNL